MSRVFTGGAIPPGGWTYAQNGLPHKITGSTYDDLINNITDARIHNNIPLGNPAKDHEEQFCQNFPSYCDPNSSQIQPEREVSDTETFRTKVASWAGNRYSSAGSIELVNEDEANVRGSICGQCPNNSEWRDGCKCIGQIDRTLLLIRQGRETKEKLLGCSCFGHDNQTAVWLPAKNLQHAKKNLETSPEFCWLRKTLNDNQSSA